MKTIDDNMLQVSASETGKGIPPSHLESIFAPFRQVEIGDARQHGGVVEMVGGSLSVRVNPTHPLIRDPRMLQELAEDLVGLYVPKGCKPNQEDKRIRSKGCRWIRNRRISVHARSVSTVSRKASLYTVIIHSVGVLFSSTERPTVSVPCVKRSFVPKCPRIKVAPFTTISSGLMKWLVKDKA